ncbi:hypothetical protein [Marinicrinis sediminis]|uniref:Phage tail protein n=1 Tax=Marinicrinis sediminis TaxID=1652465 RepID=A0ABW5R5Y7_9BACL
MKETLLVKHAIGGRTFLDSDRDGFPYELRQEGDRWHLSIRIGDSTQIEDAQVEELLVWKSELNVFLFQEDSDQPVQKRWFYVEKDAVHYDAEQQILVIEAASSISYTPDTFGPSSSSV